MKISQFTTEKLGYYVYLLIDPRDKEVFYVGKGYKKRVENHLNDLKNIERAKTRKIKEIRDSGKEVEIIILRHGLSSEQAFEVESAIIDYIGIKNLTNIVIGHYSGDRGKMSLAELEIKYGAKKAKFDDNVLLININKKFRREMGSDDILEATKGNWTISMENVKDIKIACAVYRGITREVFEIDGWYESEKKGRRYFKGRVASDRIRKKYLHKDVSMFASQFPIRYIKK